MINLTLLMFLLSGKKKKKVKETDEIKVKEDLKTLPTTSKVIKEDLNESELPTEQQVSSVPINVDKPKIPEELINTDENVAIGSKENISNNISSQIQDKSKDTDVVVEAKHKNDAGKISEYPQIFIFDVRIYFRSGQC